MRPDPSRPLDPRRRHRRLARGPRTWSNCGGRSSEASSRSTSWRRRRSRRRCRQWAGRRDRPRTASRRAGAGRGLARDERAGSTRHARRGGRRSRARVSAACRDRSRTMLFEGRRPRTTTGGRRLRRLLRSRPEPGSHLQHLVAVALELRRADARDGEQLLARARLRLGDRGQDAVREDVERRHALVGRAAAAPVGERLVDRIAGPDAAPAADARREPIARSTCARRRRRSPPSPASTPRQHAEQLVAEPREPRRAEAVDRGELGDARGPSREQLVDRAVGEDHVRRHLVGPRALEAPAPERLGRGRLVPGRTLAARCGASALTPRRRARPGTGSAAATTSPRAAASPA